MTNNNLIKRNISIKKVVELLQNSKKKILFLIDDKKFNWHNNWWWCKRGILSGFDENTKAIKIANKNSLKLNTKKLRKIFKNFYSKN